MNVQNFMSYKSLGDTVCVYYSCRSKSEHFKLQKCNCCRIFTWALLSLLCDLTSVLHGPSGVTPAGSSLKRG